MNGARRSYRHGTLSGYTAGRCRCVHCRGAFAEYRARRRGEGLDDPRPVRVRDSDGHLPAQSFRQDFWKPACIAAGIVPPVRIHDLRHSNASWLLAGGQDIEEVRERLGHTSIVTTQKYVHTLPDANDRAIAALDRVRGATGRGSCESSGAEGPRLLPLGHMRFFTADLHLGHANTLASATGRSRPSRR